MTPTCPMGQKQRTAYSCGVSEQNENSALRPEQANFTLLVDANEDAAVTFYAVTRSPFASAPPAFFPPPAAAERNPRSARREDSAASAPTQNR